MQPKSGGFWRPDSADTQGPEQDDQQDLSEAQVSTDGFVSNYDGYDMTEPQMRQSDQPAPTEVEWEASEYILHEKSAGWFIILFAVALVLFGIALLLRQWTFAAVIIAMTAAITVYAKRPPQTLHYKFGLNHFTIEGKVYSYNDFKAFGLSQDGPLHIITLFPRKRFAPAVSIYFEQDDGEQIVDLLGYHMPMQPHQPDKFDEWVRKLRF